MIKFLAALKIRNIVVITALFLFFSCESKKKSEDAADQKSEKTSVPSPEAIADAENDWIDTSEAANLSNTWVDEQDRGELSNTWAEDAFSEELEGSNLSNSWVDEDGETMGRIGQEFGATTGRSRRCGWLDLVALKYACQVNGVTQLMMMKADVLSGFKSLKVCTAYKYKGETITHLPFNIEAENISPIYTEFKGWKEDLTEMENASQLPKELNDYIDFLEKELETPIKLVSVGPDRKQTIFR